MKSLLLAAQWCHSKLPNSKGYEYLQRREINDAQVRAFGIGYFPERLEQELIDFVVKNDGDRKELFRSGVVFDKLSNASYYSMFAGRVIFPYSNAHREIIGFSGRSIDGREPKYVNSIFDKVREPYNLQRAKYAARSCDVIFIVEGHICCVTSWGRGVANVIAGGGTAITVDHLLKATRYAKTVCVIVDNDEAGLKAAEKIITFAREDFVLQVLVLPKTVISGTEVVEIKDLDDYFVKGKKSKEEFWMFYQESFRRVDSSNLLRERVKQIV